jgi:hypothetical protein
VQLHCPASPLSGDVVCQRTLPRGRLPLAIVLPSCSSRRASVRMSSNGRGTEARAPFSVPAATAPPPALAMMPMLLPPPPTPLRLPLPYRRTWSERLLRRARAGLFFL